jgi:hypothetical protein
MLGDSPACVADAGGFHCVIVRLGCEASFGGSGGGSGRPINVGSRFASRPGSSGGWEARSGSSAMVAPGGVSKN